MSDGEAELSPSQILERVKPDRVAGTGGPDEDRRRRTIIVERRNGSYGFTLQSYGIHYKREQEIEMITYVDYVDYDGPAFRAGMREGDVILSINGHDMEKVDHKTLVNFIKTCDSRMRMVVLFEDCVRKVELHMRYIRVQRGLQARLAELERLCLRERELLQGKWKTHSLPARKRATDTPHTAAAAAAAPQHHSDEPYCRPTVSTEDVAGRSCRVPPPLPLPLPNQLLLAYQYIDPHGRAYFIHPATATPTSSGEYLLSWHSNYSSGSIERDRERDRNRERESERERERKSCRQREREREPARRASASATTSTANAKGRPAKGHRSHQLCNSCLNGGGGGGGERGGDNGSLDAYDLASPLQCCHPSHCVPRPRHGHSRRHSRHKSTASSAAVTSSSRGQGDEGEKWCSRAVQVSTSQRRRDQSNNRYTSLASQCSLHSCTSSEQCGGGGGATGGGGGESSAASCSTSLSTDTLYWDGAAHSSLNRQHSAKGSGGAGAGAGVAPPKPKSWDNLTTKAFGGYGFGYGYPDTRAGGGGGGRQRPPRHRHRPPSSTKSSESLLLGLSDSSLSCECLDKASQTEAGRAYVDVQQAPQVTRL